MSVIFNLNFDFGCVLLETSNHNKSIYEFSLMVNFQQCYPNNIG